MLILGLGIGMAMNPLLLAAMSDVKHQDAGVASGVVNTAFMMGGALASPCSPASRPPATGSSAGHKPRLWSTATRRRS